MSDAAALRVLVVDDDVDTRANLRDILELDEHHVETAGSLAEVLRRRDWNEIAVVLLDRRLPDGTAEQLLPKLRQLAPQAAVIIVTGFADLEGTIAALRQGAADYILKPINPDALRASLARVAERRRLSLAKERSEAAFRSLVEAAPCLILIVRPDFRIVYFSAYAERLTGHAAAEVLGADCLALLFPDDKVRQTFRQEFGRALACGTSGGFECPIACKDGTRRWVLWNAQRLADYEGEPAVLAVGQDITDNKEAQERALQAERLAGIGQMVTGLAHESGNALARSHACLEMLALEVEDRPEALELIGKAQKAQDHLRHLYEEVRGYAAPLRLERERCDVADIWRRAWEHLAMQRQQRDAALCEHETAVDRCCDVDLFRMEQVFRNILENALAACKDPVRIEVTCGDTMLAGRPALRISLRDNGPGLNSEQRQKIFEPFYTTKTKGTGLGMAIVKRIMEAHGGSLTVGDNGPGAEIVLVIPKE
ncbi:MAG: PAS domain S-box protein [Planctomycetia bacterium]|nr:PAS domain S-box protein [Planctomycetia bacterium]